MNDIEQNFLKKGQELENKRYAIFTFSIHCEFLYKPLLIFREKYRNQTYLTHFLTTLWETCALKENCYHVLNRFILMNRELVKTFIPSTSNVTVK